MTIPELVQLHQDGKFHHATYRNIGNLWEGLYIYSVKADGLRGFELAGCFGKSEPALETAMALCKGISVGAYGQG